MRGLVCLLLIAFATGSAAQEAVSVDSTMDAVVLVTVGSTVCAGAVVADDGRVATSYHCVAGGGRPRVELRDGRRAVGRVRTVDVSHDLAIIDVPDLAGSPWLELAGDEPTLGEPIHVFGHPFGARLPIGFMAGTLRWSVAEGVVSAIGPRSIQVSAPVNPGNSGGPVVDSGGKLVAVISRRVGGSEGVAFGSRGAALRLLMQKVESPSVFGGTVALFLRLTTLAAGVGTLSGDVGLEIAIRDRVVLGGALGLAPTARWDAARSGNAVWQLGEIRFGLRQRFLRGAYAPRLDAFVAGTGTAVLKGRVAGGTVVLARRDPPMGIATGGSVLIGRWGLDIAIGLVGRPEVRTSLVWRWPGVVRVF